MSSLFPIKSDFFIEFIFSVLRGQYSIILKALFKDGGGGTRRSQSFPCLPLRSHAVPEFVRLLGSPSYDVREQCAWALGNIAGDSPPYRDHVLACGALTPILEMLNKESNQSILRNATWTLSNFCRGKPHTKLEAVWGRERERMLNQSWGTIRIHWDTRNKSA